MDQKTKDKIGWLGIVILFSIISSFTFSNRGSINRLNEKIGDLEMQNVLLYNEIDNQKQLLRPVASAEKSELYIPELRISFPYGDLSKTLQYYIDFEGGARFQSTLLVDHEMRIMSCADMVRVQIENEPNEYNPDQKLAATVVLNDGRTMQVYASSHAECELPWKQVNPGQITGVLKQAVSY